MQNRMKRMSANELNFLQSFMRDPSQQELTARVIAENASQALGFEITKQDITNQRYRMKGEDHA